MDDMKQFRYDRDDAMKAAVMDDDWDAVRRYCKKYKVPLPKDERVMKAGIYKAVQEISERSRHILFRVQRRERLYPVWRVKVFALLPQLRRTHEQGR